MKSKFLFLCGCPRSGTTALWGLLTSDQRVKLGVERYGNRFYTRDFLTPDLFEKERFFSVQQGDTFYSDLESFNPYYGNADKGYEDAVYIGDKIPKLFNYFERLQENFPTAKTIFIFRNIFDVAASYKARLLDKDDNWELDVSNAIQDWNESIRRAQAYTGQLEVIDYERLMIEGEGLEDIFDFLELNITDDTRAAFNNILSRSETLEKSRRRTLTAMEVKLICETADFDGYRKLVQIASARTVRGRF